MCPPIFQNRSGIMRVMWRGVCYLSISQFLLLCRESLGQDGRKKGLLECFLFPPPPRSQYGQVELWVLGEAWEGRKAHLASQ